MAKTTHTTRSDDYVPGGPRVLDLMASNVDLMAMAAASIEPISEREFKDAAEYEAFMQDPIVITINDSTDKNAPPIVFCGVNGDSRWLPRDIPVRLQRKFVERLAQAQEESFSTTRNADPEADNAMKTRSKQAQCYGFRVEHDPHPKGRAWLERITRTGQLRMAPAAGR